MSEYFAFKCARSAFQTSLAWGGCALLNAIALIGPGAGIDQVLSWLNFICLLVNLVGFESACRAMARGIK